MSDTQKRRVLVIEDDNSLREILVQKFIQRGFYAEGVIDREETFTALKTHLPDMILLDLLLPGVSGQDILKDLKKSDNYKGIPVIIASNLDNVEERNMAEQNGAIDYLIKTQNTPDMIVSRVEEELAV